MISTALWRARIGSYNNKRSRYSGFLSSLFSSSSSYYYHHPRKRRNLSQEHSDPTASSALTRYIRANSSLLMDSSSVEKRSLDTSEKVSSDCFATTSVTSIPSSSAGISGHQTLLPPGSSSSSTSSTTATFSSFLFTSLFSMCCHCVLREVLINVLIAIIFQLLIISGDIETNPGPSKRGGKKCTFYQHFTSLFCCT